MAAGQRAHAKLESAGQPVEEYILLPGSVSGIIPKVHDLVTKIQNWNTERNVDQVFLYYSKPLSGSRYMPNSIHLLPMD